MGRLHGFLPVGCGLPPYYKWQPALFSLIWPALSVAGTVIVTPSSNVPRYIRRMHRAGFGEWGSVEPPP